MPHNGELDLDLTGLDAYNRSGTFFDPRGDHDDHRAMPGVQVAGQPNVYRFPNPRGQPGEDFGGKDGVLGLSRSTSANLGWAGESSNRLETRPAVVDDAGSMTLLGQLTSAVGEPLFPEQQLSLPSHRLPFAGRVARDGTGNFVLAWEEVGPGEDDRQIWLRRIGSSGTPLWAQISPCAADERCRNLSVGSDAAGQFVAVWEERDTTEDRSEIRARSYYPNGLAKSLGVVLSPPPVAELDTFPHVACDANGACVAAWKRLVSEGGESALWLASFALASPASYSAYEFKTITDSAAVEHLSAEANGDFLLTWEQMGPLGESLGVFGTHLDSAAQTVGTEFQVRGAWEEE